jgi:hypothetical protein
VRHPILGADVVRHAKNHWIRIINDVTLRDGSNRRAVVYYYCDIFQAINRNEGFILVVFQMK